MKNWTLVQMDGQPDGSNHCNAEFTLYVFNSANTSLAWHGSLQVITREMFTSETLDKLKDVTATGTLKCQLLIVLHFCVNSGQINSLEDKIIIHRFDSRRLMVWPLKCHLSMHYLYFPFRRKSRVIGVSNWKKQVPSTRNFGHET